MAKVYVICDMSGSMVEDGRRFVVRNLVRTVDQYFRLQNSTPEMFIVHWSSDVDVVKWDPGQDFPDNMLACCGEASGEVLVDKLSGIADGYFMLITDGYWTHETWKKIAAWNRSLPDGHFRMLMVGVDANPKLRGPSVFFGEDVLAALDNWVR